MAHESCCNIFEVLLYASGIFPLKILIQGIEFDTMDRSWDFWLVTFRETKSVNYLKGGLDLHFVPYRVFQIG